MDGEILSMLRKFWFLLSKYLSLIYCNFKHSGAVNYYYFDIFFLASFFFHSVAISSNWTILLFGLIFAILLKSGVECLWVLHDLSKKHRLKWGQLFPCCWDVNSRAGWGLQVPPRQDREHKQERLCSSSWPQAPGAAPQPEVQNQVEYCQYSFHRHVNPYRVHPRVCGKGNRTLHLSLASGIPKDHWNYCYS